MKAESRVRVSPSRGDRMRRVTVTPNHYHPPPSGHCSIRVPRKFRYLIFPPGTTYRPPPPPSPPPEPIVVPGRSSRHHSKSEPINIVPHDRFQGVYVAKHEDGDTLYTKNLVPGQAPLHDDDVIISVKDCDGTLVEYREWNPSKSKLAAAILCGAQNIWIKPGSRVLVIDQPDGEQFGTTISHISDLVGPLGMVYVVDPSNWKALSSMADKRFNIVPIIHGSIPSKYRMLINMVDVLLAATDNPEKVQVAYLAALYFLEAGGHYVFYVKASCIESTTNRGDPLFTYLGKEIQVEFQRREQVTLEPFSRYHAYLIGDFRTLKMDEIEPGCLETDDILTAQKSNRGVVEGVSLYQQQKNLPVYMLFESSCGYALFQAVDVYQVERNYIAIEDYVNRFDEFYKLIACHPFESADDALVYLNDVYNDTLHEQLIQFLVHHLPPPKEGGKYRYTIAAPTPLIGSQILHNTNIACSASLFHHEIIRGVRMHIDKFFENMKKGDLVKAQLDLAQSYCRQKLMSPDNGKPRKKRYGFQINIPSNIPCRKNPKRTARADAKSNT